jgi:hypothetical protein
MLVPGDWGHLLSEKVFDADYDDGFQKEFLRATWSAEYYDGDDFHPELSQILGEYDESDLSLELIDPEEKTEEETFVRHAFDVPLDDER